jgi:hypothetical protein
METMAIESTESIDLEAQRAELEAVLRSEHFTRAPMLAHLLSFLCEKLFAGEAHHIKEYTVGVEVFHRAPSFDQNSDSIVRVEANRLRKRLAAYYAGDGASHRLRIVIPLGQYVPEFKSAGLQNGAEQPVLAEPMPPDQSKVENEATPQAEPKSRLQGRLARWLFASLVLLVIGLGCAVLVLRHNRQTGPQAASNQPSGPYPDAQLGPPIGDEIRILAGSGRSFVDHAGKLWSADTWFEGGTAVKSTAQHIGRTQSPDFYRSSRQGQFRYAIPLKKGIYELRLHFAETVYDPESTPAGGEGSRLMTVRANGKTLLTSFDIVADAGASRTADVKVFTGISPATDGLLHLEFFGDDGKQATLSAIEILPGFRGHIRAVRILARQTPYYSNDSRWWSPDAYFEGGQLAAYSAPVSGTDDPELYETERWGNFSYAIPVTPGKYSVALYFAVRHGDWDQSPSPSGEARVAVAHVFDVSCNGYVLLKNFDLVKEAGKADVVIRKATGLEPNAQGKLLLNFVPVEGYSTVTGIEVLPQ